MKKILSYTIVFCLTLVTTYARAAETFRSLTTTDGLSDLVVNAIYKDSLGYVWLGTGNSLERFDGIHLRSYSIAGADERLKRVNALAELPGNELWMGNGQGLWRFNPLKDSLEPVARETIHFTVRALLHDGRGTLYIGTERGLFIYRDGQLEQVLTDSNVLSTANNITGLALDADHTQLWLATEGGLCSISLADWKSSIYHHITESGHECSFSQIACIGPVIYLGTMEHGLLRFDTRTRQFAHYVDVGCNVISSLSAVGDSLLCVGTDGNGVHFLSPSEEHVVRSFRHESGQSQGLRSNSVYSVLADREGLLWVGFYQMGLDYTPYQDDLFSTYAFPPYFDSADMPVRALAIRGSEKLIGSRDGLFFIDEETHRFRGFHTPQLRSNMIFCCLFHRGEYYVGTYGGGLYILNPTTLALRDFDPAGEMPFSRGHIFCLKEDAEGNLWAGTSMGVFVYHDGHQLHHFTSANSKLPEGNVYEIYFDSSHKGWICTESGLCLWEPSTKSLKTDIFPEGFIHKEKVRVVYEDSRHQLLFLPDKGPMLVSDLSMTAFHRLPPGTPLEGRDAMFVVEDNIGWLWIGTNNGLFHNDKVERFVPYGYVDGLPGSVFTLCPPVVGNDGRIWFGNTKGLVCLDTSRLGEETVHPYRVTVTGVYINGSTPVAIQTAADGSSEVELTPSQQNVTFHFSDFCYTLPAYMRYEYCLEGVDEGWTTLVGQSEVSYYDLPSGVHSFRVRRMGEPDTETQVTVSIPLGFGWWALIAAAIFAICVIVGVTVIRNKRRAQTPSSEVASEERSSSTMLDSEERASEEPSSIHASEETQIASAEAKYKSVNVSAEECRLLLARLETLMREEKPYTRTDLKIADLAAATNTSAHTLSYLFNQYLRRNYYDYINDFRVAEFKRLVAQEEYSRYTLAALAELCGFSSRASFFRSFKKATGITPNEYVRNIGKTNE